MKTIYIYNIILKPTFYIHVQLLNLNKKSFGILDFLSTKCNWTIKSFQQKNKQTYITI